MNTCENGDHPAPAGQRFCSKKCQDEDGWVCPEGCGCHITQHEFRDGLITCNYPDGA